MFCSNNNKNNSNKTSSRKNVLIIVFMFSLLGVLLFVMYFNTQTINGNSEKNRAAFFNSRTHDFSQYQEVLDLQKPKLPHVNTFGFRRKNIPSPKKTPLDGNDKCPRQTRFCTPCRTNKQIISVQEENRNILETLEFLTDRDLNIYDSSSSAASQAKKENKSNPSQTVGIGQTPKIRKSVIVEQSPDEILSEIIRNNILSRDRASSWKSSYYDNAMADLPCDSVTTTNSSNDDRGGKNIITDFPFHSSSSFSTSLESQIRKFTIVDFLRFYRNESAEVLFEKKQRPFYCLLSLIHSGNCQVERESFLTCINRLGGGEQVGKILPAICTESTFWKHFVLNENVDSAIIDQAKESRERSRNLLTNNSSSSVTKDGDGGFLGKAGSILSHGIKQLRNKDLESDEENAQGKHAFSALGELIGSGNEKSDAGLQPQRRGAKPGNNDLWKSFSRGMIPESTVKKLLRERSVYIPPKLRSPTPFGPPLSCYGQRKNSTSEKELVSQIHPIGYGMPSTTIVDRISKIKAFDFMPLLPGSFTLLQRNYQMTIREEQVYREFYSSSYFAMVNVRGGSWTLRLLEALASGTVPYFPEIPLLGKYALTSLPKKWLRRVLNLAGVNKKDAGLGPILDSRDTLAATNTSSEHEYYARTSPTHIHFKKRGKIVSSKFNRAAYYEIAVGLLAYTKQYLTCASVAASLLQRMGYPDARRVLLISRFEYNYLYETIHQGLSELGIQVTAVGRNTKFYMQRQDRRDTIFPLWNHTEAERGHHMAKNLPGMYGHSMAYVAREWRPPLDHEYISARSHDAKLGNRILNSEFDVAIYAYVPTKVPFLEKSIFLKNLTSLWGTATLSEGKSRIAFVDCDDAYREQPSFYSLAARYGMIFAREIIESPSCRNLFPPEEDF